MNKSRKRLAFQHKLTEQLQEQIKNLEKQNKLLIKENEMLKRLNDEQKEKVYVMQSKQQKTIQKYNNGINEINTLKKKYKEVIREANAIKKEYGNKMYVLSKQLNNQIK